MSVPRKLPDLHPPAKGPNPISLEPQELKGQNLMMRKLLDYEFTCKIKNGEMRHWLTGFDEGDVRYNHKLRYPEHEVKSVRQL